MIFEKQFLFFRSLRVLYQQEDLEVLLSKDYDYMTIISYEPLPLEVRGFTCTHKQVANIHLDAEPEVILKGFKRTTQQEIAKTYSIPDFKVVMEDENFE